ncbi:uncharacterized protein LOC115756517 [Rhodamnia argentea]|uniref:Uncharacterized protein LOC115756517 n=1 Tax=Rhodamnia argentea TaxID=178133 RepID=A0A8B8R0S3_9MYRT|nr:uncharacterized protein LOC115756517 [Rhodamnia argentea]
MSAPLARRCCGSKIKLLAATLLPASSAVEPRPSPPSQPAVPLNRSFPQTPTFPRLPSYYHHHHHPHVPPLCSFPLPPSSSFSTTSPSHPDKPPHPTDYPSQNPNFKHQEIEGPTVERDLSALANETRQVLDDLIKTLYSSSKAIAALGLLQLALGAWISYLTRSSPIFEASLLGCVAFGFPFSLAFLVRQSVKPIYFFYKMEQLGRLQILTLSLQVAKSLNLFFVRARGVSYFCAAALSFGVLFTLLSK